MSYPFTARHGPIFVEAEITGPQRSLTLPLLLDTGATTSVLTEAVLVALGYDPANVTTRVPMTTGSAVISAPRVVLTRLTALGQHRFGLPCVGLHPAGQRVGLRPIGIGVTQLIAFVH